MFVFSDPLSMSPQKALETIGANLQKQYENWQPRVSESLLLLSFCDRILTTHSRLCVVKNNQTCANRIKKTAVTSDVGSWSYIILYVIILLDFWHLLNHS